MRIPRRALACALVSGTAVAPVAAGAPLQTTIRVEGASSTLVPEGAITVDDQGTTPFFYSPNATTFLQLDAARNSVLAQLDRASAAAAIPLGVQLFDFGTGPLAFVNQIGPDAGAGNLGWSFRVNHVQPGFASADQVLLKEGDSALWFYGSGTARTLDIAVSSDKVPQGLAFTVTARSFDDQGGELPAAGARISYGDGAVIADATGTARFVASGVGNRTVQAVRAGDVKSPVRAVCSFAGDPTVCNLPPAPPAPPALPSAPAAAAAAADLTAPGSRIAFPRVGRTYRNVRAVRGIAGPDRSDVARVEVAVAQRVGTQCRFLTASGAFLPPGPCRTQVSLPARSAGGEWIIGLRRALPAGLYRVWSRAVDGSGNREGVGLAGVNTLQFRVGGVRP